MRSVCLCLLFVIAGIVTCKKQEAPSVLSLTTEEAALPVSWYQLELKLIRETAGFAPPVAARAIAYTGITLHEAVATGTSLSGQLSGLRHLPQPERGEHYSRAIAANSAMAHIIRDLFPNAGAANLQLITELESDNLLLYADKYDPDEVERSVHFGQQIAEAIYQWSATDGALLPDGSDVMNVTPPAFSTTTFSAFHQAALAVYLKGVSQTPEENLIAKYWADGAGTFTTPGHLIAITAQLARERHLSLSAAATLFAQVGISMHDAGILCGKYRSDVLRPVTYIRTYIDSSWTPAIGTPSFPDYTSFTAAAGSVLSARFGSNFSFTDQQKVAEGFMPRSFNNFQSMVNEAAISRMYGGIYYEFDSEAGKQTGKDIARRVLALRY